MPYILEYVASHTYSYCMTGTKDWALIYSSVSLLTCTCVSPQMDVSVCACVSAHTSAGLLVRSISKTFKRTESSWEKYFLSSFPPSMPLSLSFCFRAPWTIAGRSSDANSCSHIVTVMGNLTGLFSLLSLSWDSNSFCKLLRALKRGWVLCQRLQ